MTQLDWHAQRAGLSSLALLDAAPESAGINLAAVRAYRLQRVRDEMRARNIGALILSDAINIRYTTGARNMQVFTSRNAPSRYLLLTEARSILYEFTGCEHLADGLETIDEVRPARTTSFVAAGEKIGATEKQWTQEMIAVIKKLLGDGGKLRIGLERMNAGVAIAFAAQGAEVVDAQAAVERARTVKSAEELKCVKASLRATENAVGKLRDAIRPGITENQLWSVLHQSVIAQNGDYCETRLLSSGARTSPWFQECSSKVIGENELVALDTDVVGCHGYYADFSRTFLSSGTPTETQRRLYRTAYEQVQHNITLLRAGLSFREYAEKAWDIPDRYFKNRYYLSAHGCGMSGEYPYLYHRADFPAAGYDGVLEAGMVICVESYISDDDGSEGVKLEEQLLITESGSELLSDFPFEDSLHKQ